MPDDPTNIPMSPDPAPAEHRTPRRMQWALAAVALLALAGCGALASLWQQAERAKEAAEARAAEAEARAAEQAQREADAARAELTRMNEKLAAMHYARAIQLAHQQWNDDNVARARGFLEQAPWEPRGWDVIPWGLRSPAKELAPPPREVQR